VVPIIIENYDILIRSAVINPWQWSWRGWPQKCYCRI